MDDAAAMRVVERGHVPEQPHGLEGREPSPFEEHAQAVAGEQPHAHPGDARVDAGGVDRNDVRMFEPGNHPRFGFETSAESLVVQEFGRQNLERHDPVQVCVLCFVDGAHPAAAKWAADDELPERRASGQRVDPVAFGRPVG